jgi:hypothetical protein
MYYTKAFSGSNSVKCEVLANTFLENCPDRVVEMKAYLKGPNVTWVFLFLKRDETLEDHEYIG